MWKEQFITAKCAMTSVVFMHRCLSPKCLQACVLHTPETASTKPGGVRDTLRRFSVDEEGVSG